MDKENIIKLVAAIIICQMAGLVGSVFTFSSIPTWYASLEKPDFNPPNWVFGPVWTTLYLLMGVSLYIVWGRGFEKKEVRYAIKIFAVQLVLNSLWSILFFGLRSPLMALVEIFILWFFIFYSILLFNRISKKSAILLMPYIMWVSFAAVLNYFIWLLN